MVEVLPFRGLLYNPERSDDLDYVVAPPYDVISAKEQDALYEKSRYNVIRLILGKAQPGDNATHNTHNRAAAYLKEWIDNRILVQDATPAIYLTSVAFDLAGKQITRYGIIGLVRLEPFDKGIVLPHERTFSKVRSERLQLMKHCHANFSPIFSLYSDNNGILARLQANVAEQTPEMDALDSTGLRHRLWPITDSDILTFIGQSMQNKRIYIADGHHRYETALNYRDWVKTNDPSFCKTHPANYVMMSLSSMEDPGLTIFPAHRLLKDVPPAAMEVFIDKANKYFETQNLELDQPITDTLHQAGTNHNTIGVFIKGRSCVSILTLKPGVMEQLFADELPASLRALDVTVLTRLLMMELLGFDQARLDDETKIAYRTTANDAIQAVLEDEADMTFILNPTKIEQVQQVAEEGLIMPRKSTYFYPKVISGQVFNLLRNK